MTFKLQTGRQKDLDKGTAEGIFRRKWQWTCKEVEWIGEIHCKEKRWDSDLDKSQEGSPETPPTCAGLAWHLAYPRMDSVAITGLSVSSVILSLS